MSVSWAESPFPGLSSFLVLGLALTLIMLVCGLYDMKVVLLWHSTHLLVLLHRRPFSRKKYAQRAKRMAGQGLQPPSGGLGASSSGVKSTPRPGAATPYAYRFSADHNFSLLLHDCGMRPHVHCTDTAGSCFPLPLPVLSVCRASRRGSPSYEEDGRFRDTPWCAFLWWALPLSLGVATSPGWVSL